MHFLFYLLKKKKKRKEEGVGICLYQLLSHFLFFPTVIVIVRCKYLLAIRVSKCFVDSLRDVSC